MFEKQSFSALSSKGPQLQRVSKEQVMAAQALASYRKENQESVRILEKKREGENKQNSVLIVGLVWGASSIE